MLTDAQTMLLLRTAASHFRGTALTAALFLLASDSRCRLGDVFWLDTQSLGPAESGSGLTLRLPHGPVIDLAPVTCDQIAAHLYSFPGARTVEADDGRLRTPLLRNGQGGRAPIKSLYAMFKEVAARTARTPGFEAAMPTPACVAVVDLSAWVD